MAVDVSGNVYIADRNNNRIREVTPTGIITTIAGTGPQGFSGDGGPATAAQLGHPEGVAVDTQGNIYITDSLNGRVRRVTPAGIISTIAGNSTAGSSGDGGPATAAQIDDPEGVTIDSQGNVYITDHLFHVVRKVTPAGIISTFAGISTVLSRNDEPAKANSLQQEV